jgi:four helix bundle protein
VHHMSLTLPRFEHYEVGLQVRRSSKSVSSQFVERRASRTHPNHYLRCLSRAYASCEETLAHIRLLIETGSPTYVRL